MHCTLCRPAITVLIAILGGCMLAAWASAEDKEINLIVVAGQSNCGGFDTRAEDLVPAAIDKEILFMFDVGWSPTYDNGLHNASSYAQWTTLRAQPNGVPRVEGGKISGYTFRTKTGGFGPEIQIARSLYENGMTNLAVLKFAFASSCFADGHWNPGDDLNRAFMSRYGQAVKKLQERGYSVRVTAVFWHQGESDTNNPEYPEHFMAFVRDLRSTWGHAELPFITSVSTPDYWLWTGEVTEQERKERNKGVGAVHAEIAERDPHIHYVDDRGCQRSKICGHYSSLGTLEIGGRMVKKFLAIYGAKKEPTRAIAG
jgi:carbohydrate esterase-like sialic acid-specific acetylesterase